jgi:predicted metalloendopeptidase
MATRFPHFDWSAFFAARGLAAPAQVNMMAPKALVPALEIIANTPLAVWRDYLRFHVLRNNAPLLTQEIDAAVFAFDGKLLRGLSQQREAWVRALALVGDSEGLGDVMGQLYVARHFRPQSKAAVEAMVESLRQVLRQRLEHNDWMGAPAKAEALRKLDGLSAKIGYSNTWRDYSSVHIVASDLMANRLALRRFMRDTENRRLEQRVDRSEWAMTPQTINAYYNPLLNEIVFPAAILQAPFFDPDADAAVNYGAIGATIGHQLGDGFDSQGSSFDADGEQRGWWTAKDHAGFDARVNALVTQYNAYCPLPGQCVNGRLTLNENIGDLGGLELAYAAYHLSLQGKPAPVIEGLSGDQRFFLAWAQSWKSKYRGDILASRLNSDPHAPAPLRINGPLRNIDAWYAAFDVHEGDKLYLKPEERVRIW